MSAPDLAGVVAEINESARRFAIYLEALRDSEALVIATTIVVGRIAEDVVALQLALQAPRPAIDFNRLQVTISRPAAVFRNRPNPKTIGFATLQQTSGESGQNHS